MPRDAIEELDSILRDLDVHTIRALAIPERDGGYTLIAFDEKSYELLKNVVEKLPNFIDRIRVEYERYRELRIPFFVLQELRPLRKLDRLELYIPSDEHLLILKCATTLCEEDELVLEIAMRGLNWDKVVEDTVRLTELAYKDRSRIIPAFELYKALESISYRLGLGIDSSKLAKLRDIGLEYFIQRIWYIDTH